ncbi:protein mono-ADP-ribosyltransferase PARP4 [Mesoplodon densirostris]|uniref:protein mono-ADP-ribosyltransferase PARP4 n=1 Tax=Mesoplodon densirostris TaxID=48708 RepID=UPI0028DC0C66|nr:protein mono-ADP-ribosyltransferase PARP4 [Mesoplodon densirostris]
MNYSSIHRNGQCTHVILDNADVLSHYQLKSIQKNHFYIANPDFMRESIKERRLVDVKNYDPCKSLDTAPTPDQKAGSSVERRPEKLPLQLQI